MRIIHFTAGLSPVEGGVVAAVRMAMAQATAGLDVSLAATLATGDDSPLIQLLEGQGVKLLRLPPELRRRRATGEALGQMEAAIDAADAVQVHGLYETLVMQVLDVAQSAGKISVLTPHGMLTPWSLKQKRLKKTVYLKAVAGRRLRRTTVLHFTTESEARASSPALPAGPRRVVIPLPLDFAAIDAAVSEPEPGPEPETARGGGGEMVMGYVGRIVAGKGIRRLIEALALMDDRGARVRLIGDDQTPFARACRDLAEQRGVGDRVEFAGRIAPPGLYTALTELSPFVLPSAHENFGQSAVEAMACGVPTLVSEGVAIGGEAVAAGAAAWISREPAELARQLDGWSDARDKRSAMGRAAWTWTRQQFAMEPNGRRWADTLAAELRP
ncbi:MAG: glycosyltransferase [Planctomycetota bacterium]